MCAAVVEGLEPRGYLSGAGLPDPTFGGGDGVVTQPLPAASNNGAAAVALQRDGRIVVSGITMAGRDGHSGLMVARYTADGVPDASFGPGHDGTVVLEFPAVSWAEVEPEGLAVQADGRIVAALRADSTDFVVARFNADGSLDTTLGGGQGYVRTNAGNGRVNYLTDLVVRPDGRLLVGGYTQSSSTGRDLFFVQFNPDGSFDKSFGGEGTGKRVLTLTKYDETVESMVLQADGSVIAAGSVRGDFLAIRLAPDGGLDKSFGDKGVVRTDLGRPNEVARAVAVGADGRIVLAGESGGNFAAARYSARGRADRTFGTGGVTKVDFGTFGDAARGVAVRPDGRVVMVGSTVRPGLALPVGDAQNGAFAVAQLTADGALDGAFGQGGKQVVNFTGTTDVGAAVALRRDGQAIVVGAAAYYVRDFAVTRLTTDGQVDTGFGGAAAGMVTTDRLAPTYFSTTGAARLPDGKLLVVGRYEDTTTGGGAVHVERFNADGSLDTTFATGGRLVTHLPGAAGGPQIVVQADGKFVIADAQLTNGDLMNPVDELLLARFNPDGTLDTTYGTGGYVHSGGGTAGGVVSMAIDASGRVVVAAFEGVGAGVGYRVRRYTTAGVLDPTFGAGGIAAVPGGAAGGYVYVSRMAIDSLGRVVLAGQHNGFEGGDALAVVRLTAAGQVDATFSAGGADGAGVLLLPVTGADVSIAATGLAVGAGDAVFVGARQSSGGGPGLPSYSYGVYKVTAGGAVDATFGEGGAIAPGVVTDVAVDADGHVLVLGEDFSVEDAGGTGFVATGPVAVSRFNADGSADATYGANGTARVGAGTGAGGARLLVDGAGRAIAIGATDAAVFLGRLTGDVAAGTFSGVRV